MIDKIINNTFNTAALQSLPQARNAPIGPGSVQGELATTRLTSPMDVAIQAIKLFKSGAIINGMINLGFNTIGAPKIIGSLILNIDGINAVFPKALPYAERALKANKIANPNVAPEPPIMTNH